MNTESARFCQFSFSPVVKDVKDSYISIRARTRVHVLYRETLHTLHNVTPETNSNEVDARPGALFRNALAEFEILRESFH